MTAPGRDMTARISGVGSWGILHLQVRPVCCPFFSRTIQVALQFQVPAIMPARTKAYQARAARNLRLVFGGYDRQTRVTA